MSKVATKDLWGKITHITDKDLIFCEDCVFCGKSRDTWAGCLHPEHSLHYLEEEIVKKQRHYIRCEDMRKEDGKCGPNATLFEPRFLKKVITFFQRKKRC